jgi:hypothetical protein
LIFLLAQNKEYLLREKKFVKQLSKIITVVLVVKHHAINMVMGVKVKRHTFFNYGTE